MITWSSVDLIDGAIGIGREVAKLVTKRWMQVRSEQLERDSSMLDLIAISVPDKLLRRRFDRRLNEIADHVAERLKPFYESEFAHLPDNERAAAMQTVIDSLANADINDVTLFQANMDAAQLARIVRDRVPSAESRALLNAAASELYHRILDDCCVQIVQIVQQLPAFSSRAQVELLQRLALAIEMLEEALIRLPRTSLGGASSDAHEPDFRRRYLQHMSDSKDALQIFGIDTKNYTPRTFVTTAYVTLTVQMNALVCSEVIEASRPDPDRSGSEPLAVESALAVAPRMLLRGDAGSGKTTLLQWIAVNSARSSFSGALTDWNGRVPFFVKLRSYAGKLLPSPSQLVTHESPALASALPNQWVETLCDTRQAILLVDGIDEVPETDRWAVKAWLREIILSYPTAIVVATSRPGAVDNLWLNSEGFVSALLEPMSPKAVEVFCHRWHHAVESAAHSGATLPVEVSDLAEYEASLLKDLGARRHLRSLASSPLLCAMICALNLDHRKQLPPDRTELYEDAIQLLVARRDPYRNIPVDQSNASLTAKTKLSLLQQIAWRFMCASQSEMDSDTVEEVIALALSRVPGGEIQDPATVARFLTERSGVLRAPAIGRVDFVHRSFQEFLAAKEAAMEHQVEYLIAHGHQDQWADTIVLASGVFSAPQQKRLISGLLDKAEQSRYRQKSRRLLLLAAACTESAERLPRALRERLTLALDPLFPPKTSAEARSLAVGAQTTLSKLPASLGSLSVKTAVACIDAVAYMNEDGSLETLKAYSQDERDEVQLELMKIWPYFDFEEYAQRVLADAPLVRGQLRVDRLDVLPYVHHINNVASTAVSLAWADDIESLDFVDDLTNVVSLTSATCRPVDLSPLKSHPNLRSLSLVREGANRGSDTLGSLAHLVRLHLAGLPADAVLSHVDQWLDLRTLHLVNCTDLVDATPLSLLPKLRSLQLDDCSRLKDLSFLSESRVLHSLAASRAGFRYGLASAGVSHDRLRVLQLRECRSVRDFEALAGSKIHDLMVADCDIEDLSPLANIPNLRKARLVGLRLSDLSPLADLPNLTQIAVNGSMKTVDLSPFAGRSRMLRVIVGATQAVVGVEPTDRKIALIRQ